VPFRAGSVSAFIVDGHVHPLWEIRADGTIGLSVQQEFSAARPENPPVSANSMGAAPGVGVAAGPAVTRATASHTAAKMSIVAAAIPT
jgi:hypothetical protein